MNRPFVLASTSSQFDAWIQLNGLIDNHVCPTALSFVLPLCSHTPPVTDTFISLTVF